MKLRFLIVCCFTFCLSVFAQEISSVKVIDYSNTPIFGAHVQFTCLDCKSLNVKILITGLDGKVTNPFAGTTQIYTSCLGYKARLDTLLPNETKSIVLQYDAVDINEVVVTAQYA